MTDRETEERAALAFDFQATMQQSTDVIRGEVHQLMAEGFTRSQACAIVARMFGWTPPVEEDDEP